MIYKTKGIVLRTIKYGETSVVVNIFTDLFGIQSYLVNGVHTTVRASSKASFFQPGSILEMEVYHNELKNLQRIKEFRWSYLYKNILSDIKKNSVAIYMIELLQKCLKQPEKNIALFEFCETTLIQLDSSDETIVANIPLYFCLHLVRFFGFTITDNYSSQKSILDLQEGAFTDMIPKHPYFLDGDYSKCISGLLKVEAVDELSKIKLNNTARREMLLALQSFYALHIQDFGVMKALPVLHEILN
jgi:DNA repair protein RecO (recombination protein O)